MDRPYLDTVIYDSFYEMIKGRYKSCPDKDAIRYMSGNDMVNITYRGMTEQIAAVYGFFRSKGMKNRHIAILSENRHEYIIIYLAAVLDNVIIPLDRELGFRQFLLLDDNLFSNHDYALELCGEIKKLKMKWMTQCSIDISEDEELLSTVAASGRYVLSFGLESISRESLVGMQKAWRTPTGTASS